MKFTISNLGKVKQADIELDNLTIVCGNNNLGKTYIAYSIYSFLSTIGFNLKIKLHDSDFNEILHSGSCDIDFEKYLEAYEDELKKTTKLYTKNVARILTLTNNNKIEFVFDGIRDQFKNIYEMGFIYGYAISSTSRVIFQKTSRSYLISCSLNNEGDNFPEKDKLEERLSFYFSRLVNNFLFPGIHYMTGERSGISLFATYLKDLSSPQTREEYLKHVSNDNGKLLYSKPLLDEIDMYMKLEIISKGNSIFTSDKHSISPVVEAFGDLAGGTYECVDGVIYYLPKGGEIPLRLHQVSSSVKALVGLNFYIKHQAQKGDILMIDEPELNLHPANQRKMARLLAMLVNAGIKVFITTHSDYIIREFNTLIMLNAPRNKRLKAIAEELGYDKKHDNCLLNPSAVRCYVVKDGTAEPMNISSKYGIEVTSFDDTINEVNALQQRILYGGN